MRKQLNIALIGYGKMGKEIEQAATDRGHRILMRVGSTDAGLLQPAELAKADVAIEFTNPEAAVANIQRCFEAGLPVVVGSTGWLHRLPAVQQQCMEGGHSLLYASNFSIGVNLFFELNRRLALLMQPHNYRASLTEIHHIHKKDHPSGTALSLANDLLAANPSLTAIHPYLQGEPAKTEAEQLPVECIRSGEVPGTHTVSWQNEIDRISITHEAFNRRGFALGAVLAAEWLPGHWGVFSMKDVLGV